MINLNPKFKTIVKDRLFYDRYCYSVSFQLDEVSCLRELSHEHIDMFIDRRKAWREISQQRMMRYGATILSRRVKEITDTTVANLYTLAELLITTDIDFKLVVSANQGWIYTNDLTLFDQLDELDILKQKSYTVAQINRPKNTIRLKNSKHQYRSYFKLSKISEQQKTGLINFFKNQEEFVRCSPALIKWTETPYCRTQDYFFVDHGDMLWLTMLSLVQPGLIRKTLQIIPAK